MLYLQLDIKVKDSVFCIVWIQWILSLVRSDSEILTVLNIEMYGSYYLTFLLRESILMREIDIYSTQNSASFFQWDQYLGLGVQSNKYVHLLPSILGFTDVSIPLSWDYLMRQEIGGIGVLPQKTALTCANSQFSRVYLQSSQWPRRNLILKKMGESELT